MNPADAAIRHEIFALVDGLPEAQKEAVTLHYGQGLSHSEVASVLEVPAGTVATRIHSGLETLRTRLAALGIAAASISVEEALRSADAATAPASLLTTVLREAAQAAPSGAGAASIVQGGLIVGKTKLSALVAVAIACTVGGGMAGYGIRSTRAERELAVLEATAHPRAATAPAPQASAGRSAVPATPAAAAAAPTARPAAAEVPAPAAPPDKRSKARKLAAFFAKALKMSEGGPRKVDFDVKESQEFFALLADPEMQKYMKGAPGGSATEDLGSDFYLTLLEELGIHFSESQKVQLDQALQDLADHQKNADGSSASAVDARIADFASSLALSDKIRSVLTPEQQEKAGPLLRAQGALGPGVQVAAESADRAAPALLESWSATLLALTEDEKARLAQVASVHAVRLNALETELSSQYGADFVDRFAGSLGSKTDWRSPVVVDPVFDAHARDAYGRFLELEQQNRQAMTAALPERAEEIRKAEANVYLLRPKKN